MKLSRLQWMVRRRLALGVFDLGTALCVFGEWLQGGDVSSVRWHSSVERLALYRAIESAKPK